MQTLVVESNSALRRLWVWHLVRHGLQVAHVATAQDAIDFLSEQDVSVMVLDLDLDGENAMAVADYASYRRPDTRIILVTKSSFFSDGTIFQHCQNACAVLPKATKPEDLAEMARHYCRNP